MRLSLTQLIRLGACALALLFSFATHAAETRVAVAANFSAPMAEIAAAFERATGHRAVPSYGSSGKLYAQIVNGAPFDVFLSADTEKPAALVAAGLAGEKSRFTYATGTLALWGPGTADARAALLGGHYRRLAIANPRLAPYGAAAIEVLQREGLADAAGAKLVSGENIAQTYQFVASGNADLGFVALSQLLESGAPPAGTWVVPASLHAPITQDAVLLKRGESGAAASAFLAFLRSEPAAAIIRRFGYDVAAD